MHRIHTPSVSVLLQFNGSHKQVPTSTSLYPARQLVQGPLIYPVAQPAGSWTQFIDKSNAHPGTQEPQVLFPIVDEQPTGNSEHEPSGATSNPREHVRHYPVTLASRQFAGKFTQSEFSLM